VNNELELSVHGYLGSENLLLIVKATPLADGQLILQPLTLCRGGIYDDTVNIVQVSGRGLLLIYRMSKKGVKKPNSALKNIYYIEEVDHLCGLEVRVPGCRPKGPGFDSQCYHIF
jgi:hypothetical protein